MNKKTYELTCVAEDWTLGTMILQAENEEDAIQEMKSYPAVKYVIAVEVVAK